MKPLISIIVPVYNVEDYLLKCLESLRRQKYQNIEIVLVDDGSTDGSGKICDDFAKTDERTKVYHKRNGGLSSARNYGLKKAKGKLVAFVDSDDYVSNNYLELMQKKMNTEVDVVVCGYNNDYPKEDEMSGENATVKLLTKQKNIDIVTWNKLYKKSLFKDVSFPEGEKHEDTLTTYKILAKARKVVYISKSLYHYIERKGSITESESLEERLAMRERAAREAIKYFSNNKKLEEAAEICLLWAKYNYLNYAINGDINEKYEQEVLKWLRNNVVRYQDNKYMSKKLRLYNILSTKFGGVLYKGLKRF